MSGPTDLNGDTSSLDTFLLSIWIGSYLIVLIIMGYMFIRYKK